MNHQGKTRKQRERDKHRQEILETALNLFAERGYANVSMQEIATTTEFAVGTLYNIFTSKEAMYLELVQTHARAMFDELIGVLDQPGTPEQRLRNLIRKHRTVFITHGQAVRLYLAESTGLGLLARNSEIQQLWQRGISRIIELIEAGIAAGTFRPMPATTVALALAGALETLAFAEIDQDLTMEATEPTVESIFLTGLLEKSCLSHDSADSKKPFRKTITNAGIIERLDNGRFFIQAMRSGSKNGRSYDHQK